MNIQLGVICVTMVYFIDMVAYIDVICRILLLFFAVKKFPSLTSFLLFPEKLSRLPVTLPILDTLDSNIRGKTFAATKRSAKTAKLFHRETKAICGIVI